MRLTHGQLMCSALTQKGVYMHIAIIGAGMAGLAAAQALRERMPDAIVTIYEKSRGFGGRVATRRRENYAFDHGAQVIKNPSPAVVRLLTQELEASALRRMELPVWTFDAAGTIAEGDDTANVEASYFYTAGNNQVGKLLAEGLNVQRAVRITAITQFDGGAGGRWQLIDDQRQQIGTADVVLFTPPAPQIIDILTASALPDELRDRLSAELRRASYRRCLSVALAYDRLVARPFYALLNTDRQHPISWLALEHAKGSERCPPGHSLLIAQMAPQWSVDQYDTPIEQLAPAVAALVSGVLGEDLDAPLWADLQRWRYALPDTGCDFATLNQQGAQHGLFFAGDFVAGRGRVHLAIERGWDGAALIAQIP